jgi:hypothetical protein
VIAKHYAEEDPNQISDDADPLGPITGPSYSNTRHTDKRRGDGGVEFVANVGYSSRNPKTVRRDGGNRRKQPTKVLCLTSPVYTIARRTSQLHSIADCYSLRKLKSSAHTRRS